MKAFISFDALFSILPILLILVYTMEYADSLNKKYVEHLAANRLHNKLVAIADLTVTKLAARKEVASGHYGSTAYPNWISENELASLNREELQKTMNLKELTIGWQRTEKNCIYRLVVFEDELEIRQLFVCGE